MKKYVLISIMSCTLLSVQGFALDGKVESIKGQHSNLERDKKISALQKGNSLFENDTVRNGEATVSKLSLTMTKPQAVAVTVYPESAFHVQEKFIKAGDKPWHLKLFSGFLRVHVKEKMKDTSFIVETPQAVIGVRGTEFTCERRLAQDVLETEKILGDALDPLLGLSASQTRRGRHLGDALDPSLRWDDKQGSKGEENRGDKQGNKGLATTGNQGDKYSEAICVLSGIVSVKIKDPSLRWDDKKQGEESKEGGRLDGPKYSGLIAQGEIFLKAGNCLIRNKLIPMDATKFEEAMNNYEKSVVASIAGKAPAGTGDSETPPGLTEEDIKKDVNKIKIPENSSDKDKMEGMHRDRESDQRRIPAEPVDTDPGFD